MLNAILVWVALFALLPATPAGGDINGDVSWYDPPSAYHVSWE